MHTIDANGKDTGVEIIVFRTDSRDSRTGDKTVGTAGDVLGVALKAPGTITQVDPYINTNAYVHACPNGGYCGPKYPVQFKKVSDGEWWWYGWTNSADPGPLVFYIYFYRASPKPRGPRGDENQVRGTKAKVRRVAKTKRAQPLIRGRAR